MGKVIVCFKISFQIKRTVFLIAEKYTQELGVKLKIGHNEILDSMSKFYLQNRKQILAIIIRK